MPSTAGSTRSSWERINDRGMKVRPSEAAGSAHLHRFTLTKTPHKKIPINAREILIGTLTDLGWGWICTWIFCLFCFDGFSESSDSLRGCYFRALLFPIATFSLSIRTNSVRVTRDSLVTAAAHTEKTRRRRNCTRQKLCQSPEIPNPFFTNAPRQDSLFCAY